MYLADYHTHSRVSHDAFVPMVEMAAAAEAAGLDEICFTDHVDPLTLGTTNLNPPYDWAPLVEEFHQAQSAWKGRTKLRLGMELGDYPWGPDWCEDVLARRPEELDFVIGSVHVLSEAYNGMDLWFFKPKTEAEARASIADYLAQAQRMATWGKFSVMGHLTLPLRYFNEQQGFHLSFEGFEAEVEDLLRTLIQNGCGIELNTNRGNSPLPDPKWLKLYRELGGEIITVGSDAHDVCMVGCKLRENLELLRQCGFKRYCTFEKMKPIWHELD